MILVFLLFVCSFAPGRALVAIRSTHSLNLDIDAEMTSLPLIARELPECLKVGSYRTTPQIVWSCLATVFACTWVAIHPNLPGPYESGYQRFRRKITITILAVIAPEFIAMFAMRQWMAAEAIKKEFNDRFNGGADPELSLGTSIKRWFTGSPADGASKGWTLAHGFFAQMGGFMMYHEGKPVQVLTFDRLISAIDRGEIDVPHIPEEEIIDKSKGDGLSKLVVVVQTTWFVGQCLGRGWIMGLPMAELELLTLAFALLNGMVYLFWWAKPQGVMVPIQLEFKTLSTSPSFSKDNQTTFHHFQHDRISTPSNQSPSPSTPVASEPSCSSNLLQSFPHYITPPCADSNSATLLSALGDDHASKGAYPVIEENFDKVSFHWIRQKLSEIPLHSRGPFKRTRSALVNLPHVCFLVAAYPFRVIYKTLVNVDCERPCSGSQAASTFKVGRTRVPMFYAEQSYDPSVDTPVFLFSVFNVPLIFGGLHLTLWWSISFYTPLEQVLWRASAFCIAAEPMLFLVVNFGLVWPSTQTGRAAHISRGLVLATVLVYAVARCILIFIAFSSISRLPEDVYRDVEWLSFLPHV